MPLIADDYDANNRRKVKHDDEASFRCCLYLPGLTMRGKPPPTVATVHALSGSMMFHQSATMEFDTGTARPSTMFLAVSLKRFNCGSLSTSSASVLALKGEA